MPPRKRRSTRKPTNDEACSTVTDLKKENIDENVPVRTKTRGRKRKDETYASIVPDTPPKRDKPSVKTEVDASETINKDENAKMKKIQFSGSVPVDEYCAECSSGYHVLIEASGDVYNAMLNQTNIGFNNNKYYFLQLLKNNAKPEYIVWFRWGRIGKIAGTTLKRHGGNLTSAKQEFEKKFKDKSGNHWEYRDDFVKIQGKYDLLEMDYGDEDEEVKRKEKAIKKEKSKKKEIESKLDKRVASVIDLIFDMKEFEAAMKEMEFDLKKAPLGKLRTKQIKAGYESLKKVEACIQKNDLGRKLAEACSEFYTRIPHDFGMKCPPLIRTPQELKLKIQLLEALSDIQIAIQLLDNEEEQDLNPRDIHYNSLGCKLDPCDPDHDEFQLVEEYARNSHGSTHTEYELKVENVFRLVREEDDKNFRKDIGNRMLLWHGSRLTNWCGILKQGLRIAPPEAPVTGYMFGKGIYFADIVSKSANYCFANKRQPVGFLLLCDVALGNMCQKTNADYNADKLPPGMHSTKGIGQEVPDPADTKKLDSGVAVPLGKPKMEGNTYLRYNEYVVYDVRQVQPRYLVQARFGFKSLW